MNVIKKRKRAVSRRRRLMGMVMLAVPLAFSVLTACSNQSGALDLTDTKKGKDFLFLEHFLRVVNDSW